MKFFRVDTRTVESSVVHGDGHMQNNFDFFSQCEYQNYFKY